MSEPKPEPPQYEVKHREQNGGAQRVYSNYIFGAKTAYDFRITFSEVVEAVGSKCTVEDRAVITISWAMAKDFCTWLGAHVAEIERQAAAAQAVNLEDTQAFNPGSSTKIQ
jgi:hypothetical protein